MDVRESTAARRHSRALLRLGAIALMVPLGVLMLGSSPAPTPTQATAASASWSGSIKTVPAPELAITAKVPDSGAVIGFLSQVIGWYRHLSVEERLVIDPADLLFVADD